MPRSTNMHRWFPRLQTRFPPMWNGTGMEGKPSDWTAFCIWAGVLQGSPLLLELWHSRRIEHPEPWRFVAARYCVIMLRRMDHYVRGYDCKAHSMQHVCMGTRDMHGCHCACTRVRGVCWQVCSVFIQFGSKTKWYPMHTTRYPDILLTTLTVQLQMLPSKYSKQSEAALVADTPNKSKWYEHIYYGSLCV